MDDREWAQKVIERIYRKEMEVVRRNADRIPYTTEDGRFDDWSGEDKICWWTNGFWAGQLWQLYHVYREDSFRETAERIEDKLDQNLMNYMGMDHDSGFKWLLTAGADYMETGNEESKNRLMLAAGNLAGRLNLNAGMIRAWNDTGSGETAGWAIIDCMMNLPLLYRASELTNDSRFAQIAECHADHAAEAFVRENGSVHHIVTFDQASGKLTGVQGGQGIGEGSSWARGQAWALYGFALSFRHTGKKEYLKVACRVAEYILSEISESGIIPVDYCQPADCPWEDSAAAAITACGLLELADQSAKLSLEDTVEKGKQMERYREAAIRLLHTLTDQRCCWDHEVDYFLEKASAAYHDDKHNFSIIYGDYYYTEALLRLCGKELFMW